MRKIVLLLSAFFTFFITQSRAQTPTILFSEDFDGATINVTNGNTGAGPFHDWHDTTGIYTSATKSYHTKGAGSNTTTYFETPSFSTVGNPYVLLSFNHIAKLFDANSAIIEISIDNGATWTQITNTNSLYLGDDPVFILSDWFNQGSHQTGTSSPWVQINTLAQPDSTWYIKENFDLTGLASDTNTAGGFTGYPNVKLRFIADFNIEDPGVNAYGAGWFIDDISITGAPCELSPPNMTFDFTPATGPSGCYIPNPQAGQVQDTSNSYPVGVIATDTASPYDQGIDSVVAVYRINKGLWDTIAMPERPGAPDEYLGEIPNVNLYDTVDYYTLAWDLSCLSNMSRNPETFQNGGFYTFWVDSAPPIKCGSAVCNSYPFIILITDSTEWVEDFEASEWQAGTGTPPNHRGTFPSYIPYRWSISPQSSAGSYGWSINSGPTSTSFTGPTGDHTSGAGKYVYLESSFTNNSSNPLASVATFTTPCIDLTRVSGCFALEYYYHMFGKDVDLLAVNVDTGSENPSYMQPIYHIRQGEDQQSSSDAWKRGVISLEQFAGSIIRLRFIARNRYHNGSSNPTMNDIAVDDLRIFQPDPVDMEVLGNTLPEDGYCSYGSSEPVDISIRNNGCITVDTIPVAFQVNNGAITRDTLTGMNLGLGEENLNQLLNKGVNFPGPGTYQLKIWTEMPGDTDLSNDTVLGPVIHYTQQITNFPYIEDFENETPGATSLSNQDLILETGLDPNLFWEVGNELTPTPGTGPYSGFYWEGNYLFANSNGSSGSVNTYIRSLCFDLSGMTNPTLSFLYHDYADDFQNLIIEISKGNENNDTWTTVPGSAISANGSYELNDWELKQVDLSSFASQSSSLKIRFKAQRKSTAGDETNFAIDNITVYDAINKDGGAFSLKVPVKKGIIDLSQTPQVAVANYGVTNLTNYTVNMDVTPLCGTNPQTTSYSQSFSTAITPGNTQTVTLNSANVTWPVGECEVCIYTSITGDTYAFNDTICRNVIAIGEFDIPYVENFDSCNYSADGYFPGGPGLLQWEMGTPSFGFTALSSPNVWATNLDGPFAPGTIENLTVPLLGNFDTIVGARLHVVHNFNFGSSSGPFNAAGTLEYYDYSPGQQGFKILGGDRVGLPGTGGGMGQVGEWWYDSQIGDLQIGLFGDKPGWVGNSNGYKHSIYPLNEFNRDTLPLRLRFRFQSNASASPAPGWAIDTVYVEVPPQNSVSPISATTVKPLPYPGFDQELLVRFRNTGEKELKEFKYTVTIDGNAIGGTDHVIVPQGMRPILKNDVVTDTFDFPWPANLVTPGPHTICVTTSRPNAKEDNRPADDNNCFEEPILREIDLTSTGDSSFCDDFEGSDSEWKAVYNPDLYDNVSTSWEHGVPTRIDTGAHSGNKVWMTDTAGNYPGNDDSGLWSPIFNVDSGQTYEISFWHWFKTEKYHDGGNVEVSYDQGLSWRPFGYSIQGKNWFNTAFVTALDKIRGGWTDSSDGWTFSSQRIAFQDDLKVVFRYRFGSDYSIENEGWAIDDFCLEKSSDPEIVIGEGEYQIPTEVLVSELVPNPASNWADLNVHLPSRTAMKVKVYNMVGQLVESRSEEFSEGSHTMSFQTSNWNSGVYLVSLEYNGETVTRKLVVSH